MEKKPHIAILGGGPTGLEAALAAAEHGYPFTLYEAAPKIAGHVRAWGHVRVFTPWQMDVSERMRKVLVEAGHEVPSSDDCPTGDELVDRVLEPLTQLPQMQGNIRCGVRVRHLGRQSLLKHEEIGTGKRSEMPFQLLLEDLEGHQWSEVADILFDCTGNTQPNSLGSGGIPAPGEEHARERIRHEIPDFRQEKSAFSGHSVLLVGAGHSAQTALLGLADLAEADPETRIVWVLRGKPPQRLDGDPLPHRAELTGRVAELAKSPPNFLEVYKETTIEGFSMQEQVVVTLRDCEGETQSVKVDEVLSLIGNVGDRRLYRQLQVHECYATQGPMKLAAALLGADGGGGDCLEQTSLGPETLKNPEANFFILGMKSYGRRNDYLMRVGWQQVEEVFTLLP